MTRKPVDLDHVLCLAGAFRAPPLLQRFQPLLV